MYSITTCIIAVVLYLLGVWLAHFCIKYFRRAEQEESKLRTDNDALKRRNEWLESEVKSLKAALRAYGDEDIDVLPENK